MTRQVVLVTGSSSGVGRFVVETLARRGHTVFASMRGINGRNAQTAAALRALAQAEGLALEPLELDVTSDASVQQAIQSLIAQAGRIDTVINNAGVGLAGITEATSLEQARTLFDVNLFGVLRVNQAVLPHMRQQRSGLLVYLSSTASRSVFPLYGWYSATKAALDSLARGFDADLKGFGIDTTIIQAGLFATDFGLNTMGADLTSINEQYGELGQQVSSHLEQLPATFSPDIASNPQHLADLIAELVEQPQGQRPLYAAGGLGSEQIHLANQGIHEFENSMLRMFGAEALAREVITYRAGLTDQP